MYATTTLSRISGPLDRSATHRVEKMSEYVKDFGAAAESLAVEATRGIITGTPFATEDAWTATGLARLALA